MRYEEFISVEEQGEEKEILRLHDLGFEFVLDYYKAPNHIQQFNISTGKLIAKYPYGNDGDVEGFSFAVSPRHNYLIIKQVVYGQSLDDLYATIYCIKDKRPNQVRNSGDYGPLKVQDFHSYYHLSFLFSNDEDEEHLWLHGREVGDLPVIDEYLFGDIEPLDGSPDCKLARFYKVASYPKVALDKAIRDKTIYSGLTPQNVVNDLEKIQREDFRRVCGLAIDNGFAIAIKQLVNGYAAQNPRCIVHSVLAADRDTPDLSGFKSKLKQLGITFETVSESTPNDTYDYFVINVPFFADPVLVTQSIVQLSDTCQAFGLMYEGFTLGNPVTLKQWDDCVKNALAQYRFLSQCVAQRVMSVETFSQRFYQLYAKHDRRDFDTFFNQSQHDAIDAIKLALSRFDDWDIKEQELLQQIGRFADLDN